MNRAIKFRFWSNHLGKFVVPDDSIFVGALKDPDMNPMQFTGLTDRNGVEIYEGDIVTWWVNGQEGVSAPIIFDNGHFFMGEAINKSYGLVINDWLRGEYEVIGNIYENPELLEAKP